MIAAYAMETPSSFHLIRFPCIFIIPNPSLGIFNIITHTHITIGYVTRNVLSIIVLVHSSNRTRSLLTRSTRKRRKKKRYSNPSNATAFIPILIVYLSSPLLSSPTTKETKLLFFGRSIEQLGEEERRRRRRTRYLP